MEELIVFEDETISTEKFDECSSEVLKIIQDVLSDNGSLSYEIYHYAINYTKEYLQKIPVNL